MLSARLKYIGRAFGTRPIERKISSAIARALRDRREALAVALVDSVADWEKYAAEISESPREFACRETIAFVDYLTGYFNERDPTYRSLYIGLKLKQCYSPTESPEAEIARRQRVTEFDRKAILGTLHPWLASEERELLATELDAIHAIITKHGEKVCHVLLVGDCLFLDILAFLTAPLFEAGIQLAPIYVTSKRLSEQQRDLRQLEGKKFDLVFYSPLTYAFHPSFSEFQYARTALYGSTQLEALAAAAQRDIDSMIQLMEGLFECPIFVHNTANIRRHDGTAREIAKTMATQATRRYTRMIINDWLPKRLDLLNAKLHRHLFLLDEMALLATASEYYLSQFFYDAPLQHPVRFGQALAPIYQDIIIAQFMLANKKLIICDLDDTLWKGTIGEGAVEHYADRQATLLALRRKGVLLAICSKNDPKNVHWHGGTLSADDFVCSQINWEPKVVNIRRLARQLNLKTKDFLFIDDRADERELVSGAMPEVVTLDAQSPRTWRQLDIVANIIAESVEGDRTLAYKQKEQRERFLTEAAPDSALVAMLGVDTSSAHDQSEAEALKKLKLQLSIRLAERRELKRVSELINRTNQFNTCGSRTSLQEVTRWHDSERHAIWVAEARDKFGPMGTVAVAVVEETMRGVEILVFVLSCRVFGYGMENALLNRIKSWRPGKVIYGHFKETPHNQPCHRVYPENGFTWNGGYWTFHCGKVVADPVWLTIESSSISELVS